jgi:hypothetical protein
VAVAAPVAGLGCEDKKATDVSHGDAGAGTDKYATADTKLTKAIMAATSASAAADNGPPPSGFFEGGAADQRHAKGAPTKVEVVSDGSDPKVSLAPAGDGGVDPRASSYGPLKMEVAQQLVVQQQRAAMPTVDFAFVLVPAKKEDGGPDWLLADVAGAMPAHDQAGQLPPGMDKDMGLLSGTEIRIKLGPDGKESDATTVMAKAAKPDFDVLAQHAAEALVLATVPLPGKPVGVGAQWIAETRMQLSGVDVVAYRAYKVKSIDGDRLHLDLDVKAYATSDDIRLSGLPQLPAGMTLAQFDTQSQGEVELVRGEVLARKLDVQQRVVAVYSPPGAADKSPPSQQPNVMPAQVVSQATLVRGSDLRQAMKQ